MTTPSKLAESMAKRMLVAKAKGAFDQEYSSAVERVAAEADEALAPVRECLEGLRTGALSYNCWCSLFGPVGAIPHSAACLAAQQLYERLKQS